MGQLYPGGDTRDRNSEFEPKIVPKYQRNISGIEDKIIALYARGMSTRDIHDQVKDIYGIEVSAEMVSKITEKIVPEIKEWQSRPLETVYLFFANPNSSLLQNFFPRHRWGIFMLTPIVLIDQFLRVQPRFSYPVALTGE